MQTVAQEFLGRDLSQDEVEEVLRSCIGSDRQRLAATMAEREPRKLTPPLLAKRWGVNADKVLAFIHSGELRAVDVAAIGSSRPRYVIDEQDVAAFEARRANTTNAKPQQKRRGKNSRDIAEFF